MIPTRIAIRPAANVTLPHQSILAGWRTPRSTSLRHDHSVPKSPTGTETRNTSRHDTGPSTPPSTRPMNDPAMPATVFTPSASPRWLCGKASVRIAEEFANRNAPPTPWPTRITIIQSAPAPPCIHVTDRSTEKTVKIAKPSVNMRTRP